MDNKINVNLIVPSIGERYNIFIPVNKTIDGNTLFNCIRNVYTNVYCYDENNKFDFDINGGNKTL